MRDNYSDSQKNIKIWNKQKFPNLKKDTHLIENSCKKVMNTIVEVKLLKFQSHVDILEKYDYKI
jgi:hypothetical protein